MKRITDMVIRLVGPTTVVTAKTKSLSPVTQHTPRTFDSLLPQYWELRGIRRTNIWQSNPFKPSLFPDPRPIIRPFTSQTLIDSRLYFCKYRTMKSQSKKMLDRVSEYADMLYAMGAEPRLRIMRLLLSAHPDGLVVADIQQELDIPNSTLSHHLEKLKNEDLVRVQRESTFLRYSANTESLQELLGFLYAECCTRNQAIKPENIVQISR